MRGTSQPESRYLPRTMALLCVCNRHQLFREAVEFGLGNHAAILAECASREELLAGLCPRRASLPGSASEVAFHSSLSPSEGRGLPPHHALRASRFDVQSVESSFDRNPQEAAAENSTSRFCVTSSLWRGARGSGSRAPRRNLPVHVTPHGPIARRQLPLGRG